MSNPNQQYYSFFKDEEFERMSKLPLPIQYLIEAQIHTEENCYAQQIPQYMLEKLMHLALVTEQSAKDAPTLTQILEFVYGALAKEFQIYLKGEIRPRDNKLCVIGLEVIVPDNFLCSPEYFSTLSEFAKFSNRFRDSGINIDRNRMEIVWNIDYDFDSPCPKFEDLDIYYALIDI